MEELCEAIERKKALRCGALGIAGVLFGAYVIGGALWGVREYREHNGDVIAAEAHADRILSDNTLERIVLYASKPGRQLGYWLASR